MCDFPDANGGDSQCKVLSGLYLVITDIIIYDVFEGRSTVRIFHVSVCPRVSFELQFGPPVFHALTVVNIALSAFPHFYLRAYTKAACQHRMDSHNPLSPPVDISRPVFSRPTSSNIDSNIGSGGSSNGLGVGDAQGNNTPGIVLNNNLQYNLNNSNSSGGYVPLRPVMVQSPLVNNNTSNVNMQFPSPPPPPSSACFAHALIPCNEAFQRLEAWYRATSIWLLFWRVCRQNGVGM